MTASLSVEVKPIYCAGWTKIDEPFIKETEENKIEHQRKQETFFKYILCQILVDKKNLKYLSLFVKFCTGYDYIPNENGNPSFNITVEFNFAEPVENAYPVAHICVNNTLKLPRMLYTKGNNHFEMILTDVLNVYVEKFSMK